MRPWRRERWPPPPADSAGLGAPASLADCAWSLAARATAEGLVALRCFPMFGGIEPRRRLPRRMGCESERCNVKSMRASSALFCIATRFCMLARCCWYLRAHPRASTSDTGTGGGALRTERTAIWALRARGGAWLWLVLALRRHEHRLQLVRLQPAVAIDVEGFEAVDERLHGSAGCTCAYMHGVHVRTCHTHTFEAVDERLHVLVKVEVLAAELHLHTTHARTHRAAA